MTSRLRNIALYVFAGMAVVASPAHAEIDEATIAHIEDQVENGRYPGVMIALVEGDEVTYRGFGVISKESGAAPDADTLFEIGSITKTFTGLLLASLAADGTLSLDDPAQNYLPEGVTLRQAGEAPITLLDIATHRSGLPRLPADFSPADPLNPYSDYGVDDLWTSVNATEPARAPGTAFEYSNFGFGLLGIVLARASGDTYEALLRRRVFEPLGMADTGLAITANLAQGYDPGGNPTPPWDIDAFAGAGAIRSTARDMVKYLRANMGEAGPGSLQAAAMAAQEPLADLGRANIRVGLAWMTMPAGTGRWHEGGTYGFHSFAGVDREKRRAVLVWTNTFDIADPLVSIGMHLLDPEIPLPPLRPARAAHVEIVMLPEELAAYEGSYRMDFGATLTVRLEGSQLMAQLSGQPAIPVFPEAPERFFYRAVEAELVFSRGEDGRVDGVMLRQSGQQFTGTRVEPAV